MKFDTYLISILLAGVIIVSGLNIVADQEIQYGVHLNDTIFTKDNLTADIQDLHGNVSNQMKEGIEAPEASSDTALDNIFIGGISVLGKIWQSVRIAGKFLNNFAVSLGIPSFILNIFMMILMAAIIFALIHLYLRFQPR